MYLQFLKFNNNVISVIKKKELVTVLCSFLYFSTLLHLKLILSQGIEGNTTTLNKQVTNYTYC